MEKLVILTEEEKDMLCVLRCNHFIPVKGRVFAPFVQKSDVITSDMLYDIKVDFIENEYTFSIFDKSFGEYQNVILKRYEKRRDGSIALIDKHYECIILTNEAYEKANVAVHRVLQIAENYSEIESIMCSIRCGGNIVCVPSVSSTKFEQFYEYFGAKFLWKGNGISIFGIPFNSLQRLVELIVPDFITSMVVGKGGENLKRMASEMNVSRINIVCSSWLRE